MNEKYRKIIAWVILIIALAIMFFGGKFTGNGYAVMGFFLLLLSLLLRYGHDLTSWIKSDDLPDVPKNEQNKIIDIELWIEKKTAIIQLFLNFQKHLSHQKIPITKEKAHIPKFRIMRFFFLFDNNIVNFIFYIYFFDNSFVLYVI